MNRPQTNQRRPDGAALFIAFGLAALGAVLIWQGYSIPDKGGYAGVGSGGLPKFIGGGLLFLALGHVVAALKIGKPAYMRPDYLPVLWVICGLILQLILLRSAGFSVASGLLFACTAAGFGKHRLALTVPLGITLSLLIYGVFDQLLKLKLPSGVLENLIFGG
jgi:putative tricarboxylic transport membrane protein